MVDCWTLLLWPRLEVVKRLVESTTLARLTLGGKWAMESEEEPMSPHNCVFCQIAPVRVDVFCECTIDPDFCTPSLHNDLMSEIDDWISEHDEELDMDCRVKDLPYEMRARARMFLIRMINENEECLRRLI